MKKLLKNLTICEFHFKLKLIFVQLAARQFKEMRKKTL